MEVEGGGRNALFCHLPPSSPHPTLSPLSSLSRAASSIASSLKELSQCVFKQGSDYDLALESALRKHPTGWPRNSTQGSVNRGFQTVVREVRKEVELRYNIEVKLRLKWGA